MINQLEKIEQHFGTVAALIGERSRAIMLWNLLDGRAYTAGELAVCADISKQACSSHLLKLVEAGILRVEKQGRHKYYSFASDKVAQVIEGIAFLLPAPEEMPWKPEQAYLDILEARTCYDHLAGKLGVSIRQSMLQQGILLDQQEHFSVSREGNYWFGDLGIDLNAVFRLKRKFAFPCLDWSERKPHLGGALGAVLLNRFLELDWLRKTANSRAVFLTAKGKAELRDRLALEFPLR